MGFKDSLTDGVVGEFVVFNYLSKLPSVKQVIDVRDDKIFQQFDVDYLVETTNRQYTWVEIKTDYKAYETGNFVYEYQTSGNVGCFEKTKAQIIAYYVPQSGNIYMLDVAKLRNYVSTTNLRLVNMGDNANGYLLNIAELERASVICCVYKAESIMKCEVNDK